MDLDFAWMAARLREQGCEILALKEAIERQRAEWQPIGTVPIDGTSFLAWDEDHDQMAVCYFSADRTLCFEANEAIVERDDHDDSVGFWPSHWRPRPAPPT